MDDAAGNRDDRDRHEEPRDGDRPADDGAEQPSDDPPADRSSRAGGDGEAAGSVEQREAVARDDDALFGDGEE